MVNVKPPVGSYFLFKWKSLWLDLSFISMKRTPSSRAVGLWPRLKAQMAAWRRAPRCNPCLEGRMKTLLIEELGGRDRPFLKVGNTLSGNGILWHSSICFCAQLARSLSVRKISEIRKTINMYIGLCDLLALWSGQLATWHSLLYRYPVNIIVTVCQCTQHTQYMTWTCQLSWSGNRECTPHLFATGTRLKRLCLLLFCAPMTNFKDARLTFKMGWFRHGYYVGGEGEPRRTRI